MDGKGQRWLVLGVIFIAAVVVEGLVALFMRSKGVNLTGDSPSYIIQAQSYVHLTPHILPTIKSDLRAHSLTSYAVGAPTNVVAQFPVEPGMGILLIPFVAFGRLYFGATLGMLCYTTAGLILLHQRVKALTGLSRRGQVLLALLFVGPAMLVSVNQIYPDLPSGVLIGCALVELALMERSGKVTWVSYVVVTASAAMLPWLQIKNLVPALVLLVAFAFVAIGKKSALRPLAVVCAICVLSWLVLLWYNEHYFGHLLGLPEAAPKFTRNGVEYTLGLLFDRDQGLFVQIPFALIGLIGLWLSRRKLPVAVVASVVSLGVILVLNGTYIVNPYGGFSLAGRFMLTLIPAMLMWTAVVIAQWEDARRLLWVPIGVVIVAWIYMAVPILRGQHVYYNVFSFTTPPTSLSAWPGWWPGLDRVLSQFELPGHFLGAPSYAVVVELVFAAILIVCACLYLRPAPERALQSERRIRAATSRPER
jgi:hypothetical protein